MSKPMTSRDTTSAISLQESADGATPFVSLDGPMTDLFGREAPLASRTQSPALLMAERKAKAMNDTFGRPSAPSSHSVSLQRSLENKLRTRLPGDGSTPFVGTWKHSTTPVRRSYSQLVPSKTSMKESGYIGLPTPAARDGKDISRSNAFLSQRLRHSPSLATHLLTQGAPWTAITAIYALTMGYPLPWNDARPRDTATRLSRKSQPK